MSSFFDFKRGREPVPTKAPSSPTPAASPQPRQTPRPTAPSAGTKTHIARGTKVVGEITGNAELLIDGVVEGEIRLDSTLVIGEEGKVHGTVYAISVQVGGKIYGDVSGKERVEVLASGGLEGDIVAPSVRIAEGAFYKGKVDMSSPKQAAPAKAATGGSSKTAQKAPKAKSQKAPAEKTTQSSAKPPASDQPVGAPT